jgi:hypothetical protein
LPAVAQGGVDGGGDKVDEELFFGHDGLDFVVVGFALGVVQGAELELHEFVHAGFGGGGGGGLPGVPEVHAAGGGDDVEGRGGVAGAAGKAKEAGVVVVGFGDAADEGVEVQEADLHVDAQLAEVVLDDDGQVGAEVVFFVGEEGEGDGVSAGGREGCRFWG